MAADLHIHVADESLRKDLERYVQIVYSSSKGGEVTNYTEDGTKLVCDREKIESCPSIWIGEVSWLKASLLEDSDTFVPATVMRVSEIVGSNLRTIDDQMITEVKEAFDLKNSTQYALTKVADAVDFLESNKGKIAFQISW